MGLGKGAVVYTFFVAAVGATGKGLGSGYNFWPKEGLSDGERLGCGNANASFVTL